MLLFCSWLNSMSMCDMILWNNTRKKQKSLSSGILRKCPASLTVGGSKLFESLTVWSSLCSYIVEVLLSCWSSNLDCLKEQRKNASNPLRKKKSADTGRVWCCLMHDEVQLMHIAVEAVFTWEDILSFYTALHLWLPSSWQSIIALHN